MKKRVLSYDIIRIVAVLAVVMIHASAGDVISAPVSSTRYVFANIFDAMSRIGVPLFVMLSGALMLNEHKETPFKKILKNAVVFFVLLYVWSFLYAVYYSVIIPLRNGEGVAISAFLSRIIFGYYHLWYLFMLVGLYLITPILRLFVKKENSRYILYFILLSAVFSFCKPLANFAVEKILGSALNTENLVLEYINGFHLGFLNEFVTYYLIGWYISNVEIKKNIRRWIYVSGALGLIVTVVGSQIFSSDTNRMHAVFYDNKIINVMLYAVAVFTFIFYAFKDKTSEKFSKVLSKLSELTFGVYLIHIFILNILSSRISISVVPLNMIVFWVLTAVLSFAVSYVISKIPIVKKLIKL